MSSHPIVARLWSRPVSEPDWLRHSLAFSTVTVLTQWIAALNWPAILAWLLPYAVSKAEAFWRSRHRETLRARDDRIAALEKALAARGARAAELERLLESRAFPFEADDAGGPGR